MDIRKKVSHLETALHLKRPCLTLADLDRALTIDCEIVGLQLDYCSR
ncbi:hypothetical protein [Myxosarcina sp. GI1(2024)]